MDKTKAGHRDQLRSLFFSFSKLTESLPFCIVEQRLCPVKLQIVSFPPSFSSTPLEKSLICSTAPWIGWFLSWCHPFFLHIRSCFSSQFRNSWRKLNDWAQLLSLRDTDVPLSCESHVFSQESGGRRRLIPLIPVFHPHLPREGQKEGTVWKLWHINIYIHVS